jgi:amino acid transporter
MDLLVGKTLPTSAQDQVKMGVFAGVSAMGLDALSSAAYGPEAALTVLAPLGAAGLVYIGPITLVILALLAMLYFSYRQTIAAYPNNGGSYTVAKENLGTRPGLLAAAALAIDYVLNVAVGISAGIAALISAAPSLQRFTLPLCLGTLVLITLLNLRGTREAGLAFAVPTYLFIVSLLALVGVGVVRSLTSGGHPHALVNPPALPAASGAASLWVLLRAFASGCTAMTGVEAVSNGVSSFKQPTVPNAHRTLTTIVIVLAILLGGVAYLSHSYQIGAMDQSKGGYQSIFSQLTSAIMGRGAVYYITIGSVLASLCLSANTSFVDFPRLCRLVAQDDFLPRGFAVMGRRLVYSIGILFLAVCAASLLIAFRGITDRLIPLFAVGAFLAFTLSQMGMVVHWHKQIANQGDGAATNKRGLRVRLWINGIGGVATGFALAIILLAKFAEGAWITVLAIPSLVLLFTAVNRHYARIRQQVQTSAALDLDHNQPPVVLVMTKGWNRITKKALRFAMWLSGDVIAVHLSNLSGDEIKDQEDQIRRDWKKDVEEPARRHNIPVPKLVLIACPYREFVGPMVKQINKAKSEFPGRLIAVVIPKMVEKHWWNLILHQRLAAQMRAALLDQSDHEVVLVEIPWYVDADRAG